MFEAGGLPGGPARCSTEPTHDYSRLPTLVETGFFGDGRSVSRLHELQLWSDVFAGPLLADSVIVVDEVHVLIVKFSALWISWGHSRSGAVPDRDTT